MLRSMVIREKNENNRLKKTNGNLFDRGWSEWSTRFD